MCTAITLKTKDLYFGRTLDLDHSYREEVTLTPRQFPLNFLDHAPMERHYAILGMAHIENAVPLYYDAMNEKGLCMAGLNFVGNAVYQEIVEDRDNIAHFELIPWILAQCDSTAQAVRLLEHVNITNRSFSDDLPCAQLHWIIADRGEAVTVEAVKEGLRIYDNPAGVLTNNPPFDEQLFQLNNYMHLSPQQPENHFFPGLDLQHYSHGMGAMGLPGDLSSQSRFVRAAFTKLNSRCGVGEEESVSQFFHILDTVFQTKGCCKTGKESYEITLYTSCCNADQGIYYYTTYENRQIQAVRMHTENLEGKELIRFPLVRDEKISYLN